MSSRKTKGKGPASASLKTPLLDELPASSQQISGGEARHITQSVPSDTPSTLIESSSKTESVDRSVARGLRDSQASDLNDHKPTVTFADDKNQFEGHICIPALLSKIPRCKGGVKQLKCGGVEAIPVISGEDVKVYSALSHKRVKF